MNTKDAFLTKAGISQMSLEDLQKIADVISHSPKLEWLIVSNYLDRAEQYRIPKEDWDRAARGEFVGRIVLTKPHKDATQASTEAEKFGMKSKKKPISGRLQALSFRPV